MTLKEYDKLLNIEDQEYIHFLDSKLTTLSFCYILVGLWSNYLSSEGSSI